MSTAVTQPHGTSATMGTRSLPTHEFSKRKRWGDLLLTELVDVVAFILSPNYKILYCGPAVTELLGWRDMDLSDLDFIDLVDTTDQARFRIAFDHAVRTNTEFDLAVKLRANTSTTQYINTPAPDVLFNIKFYPHVASSGEDEMESKCIFAMASPYPSRNTAILEASLDLRAENERLQQKVMEHRNRIPAEVPSSKLSPPSQASSMYATSSLHSAQHTSGSGANLHNSSDPLGPGAFSPATMMSESFNATTSNATDGVEFGKSSLYTSVGANLEDQVDEGSKKKKLKRAQNAEQYVCITCGRTDSPEWRKGPLGPKTLCNACGLRWAKQMRKVEDPDLTNGVSLSAATAVDSLLSLQKS